MDSKMICQVFQGLRCINQHVDPQSAADYMRFLTRLLERGTLEGELIGEHICLLVYSFRYTNGLLQPETEDLLRAVSRRITESTIR
jgi:hypothetical protein